MAPDADPYRTLGLARDATLDEVRRAYRRLAKANHPDAAGEAALPRFLAIQAAYDLIAGPEARGRRPGPTRPSAPRRPWDADRERTDATYRAYGGRARRARPSGPAASGRGSAAGEGPAGPAGPSRPPRPQRPPNKATLGSTSYDGADVEPFEPDWGGASWYGTTSGTYWTLNPKEYADPRKHGPEYQARARRKLGGREEPDGAAGGTGWPTPDDAPVDDPVGGAAAAGAAPEQAGASPEPEIGRATPPPTHTTSSWWEATVGDPPRSRTSASAGPRAGPRPGPRARAGAAETSAPRRSRAGESAPPPRADAAATASHRPPSTAPATPSDLGSDAILAAVRTWLDDPSPGAIGRVSRAVLGWAPIALGIGWLSGELSGCGRFAAGCDDTAAISAWAAQIAALVVLLVVGRLARIASLATLTTLAAAIPAALLLTATGAPDDVATGRSVLSGLLAIAWAVGLVLGVTREWRATVRGPGPPGVSGSAGPVS